MHADDPVIAALLRLLERKPGDRLHRRQLHARCYGAGLRRLHLMAVLWSGSTSAIPKEDVA